MGTENYDQDPKDGPHAAPLCVSVDIAKTEKPGGEKAGQKQAKAETDTHSAHGGQRIIRKMVDGPLKETQDQPAKSRNTNESIREGPKSLWHNG
jgi:hypothetical protein